MLGDKVATCPCKKKDPATETVVSTPYAPAIPLKDLYFIILTKLETYLACVRSILLHGCETSPLKTQEQLQVGTLESK